MSQVASPHQPDGALSVQLRLLVALVLRGLVSEVGSTWSGLIGILFRPAFIIVAFYLLYSVFHRLTPQGMPLMGFLVTGWLSWFMFIRTFRESSAERGAGKLLMFPHMTPLDLHVSNAILQWFIYTFVFILFSGGALLLERSAPPASPLVVVIAFWSVAVLGALLGLVFSSIGRIVPIIDILVMPIRRLGQFMTGVVVTAADTPNSVLQYMSWNPVFHAIEIMREAWWPAYVSPIADPWHVLRCVFFMAVIGLILERATRRFIRS